MQLKNVIKFKIRNKKAEIEIPAVVSTKRREVHITIDEKK